MRLALADEARAARLGLVVLLGSVLAAGFLACQTSGVDVRTTGLVPTGHVRADDLLVVDCLLPGQVRKLGRSNVMLTPRRPIKTSASDCEIRGGEYVAYDRADYRTALRIWQDQADSGDPKAQTYVGEIYEKGLGTDPDYAQAAAYYRRAADSGYAPAQLALGNLYQQGLGVPRDPQAALDWFRKASGLADLGIAYATASPGASGAAGSGGIAVAALAAPSIQLLEPAIPTTRGLKLVEGSVAVSSTTSAPQVVGRVDAPAGLARLLVDGLEQDVDASGIFRAALSLPAGGRDVHVTAIDREGRESVRRFFLRPDGSWTANSAETSAPSRDAYDAFGRYHALVIGNQRYRKLQSLETARADADAVAAVLSDKYGFQVTLLHDATRYDVLSALNDLRARLGQDDNLLIYYAGHGELDEANMRGHWLPVDAEIDSTANWISNVAITDILNAMSARHILVVSDSCYSGSLTRASLAQLDAGMNSAARAAWVRAMASKRSRTALTSGGLAPVLDEGGGGHSVFARAFLEVLRQNQGIIEGQRLYRELSARVTYAAEQYRFEQLPQYAPIRHAGHESGEFFLLSGS